MEDCYSEQFDQMPVAAGRNLVTVSRPEAIRYRTRIHCFVKTLETDNLL